MSDEEEEGDSKVVVIDAGANSCRAGFASDDVPRLVFPCIVGYPKSDTSTGKQNVYLGDDVTSKWSQLKIRFPIEHCIITDWDAMETVWRHSFNTLGVSSEDQPVVLTESPRNTKGNREKTTEMMFETFNVPALRIGMQSVLSLFATGNTTGVVVDCGEGVINTVPVYEGYHLPHAMQHIDIGGRNLTSFLRLLLNDNGHDLPAFTERNVVREMKEKLCHVALDYDDAVKTASLQDANVEKYTLPDGTVILLKNERFVCAEALFRPTLMGAEFPGIHELANSSITRCDPDLHRQMRQTVLLSGGSSMFPGTAERLEKELKALQGPAAKVKILAPPNRALSAWKGGATLGSLSTFKDVCMTKEEYDEYGPHQIHKKV